jgi:hypothetical protein
MSGQTNRRGENRRARSGWVIRYDYVLPSGKRSVSWWHGPDTTWATSFGPLVDERTMTISLAVAVFVSREDARSAIWSVGLHGVEPVRLENALDEVAGAAA